MEMILTRIGPIQDKRPPPLSSSALVSKARIVDPRTYEFFCLWPGSTGDRLKFTVNAVTGLAAIIAGAKSATMA
jgi:hypothetical protein